LRLTASSLCSQRKITQPRCDNRAQTFAEQRKKKKMKTFVATFLAILAAAAVIFTALWAKQRIDQRERAKEMERIDQWVRPKETEVENEQKLNQAWAAVFNVYQRRADLIPDLINTVAGAANFEKLTLVEVTNALVSVGRVQLQLDPNKAPADAAQLEQFQAAQGQLSNALSRLLLVSERYPELKANQYFLSLQAQLEGIENRISVERGNFNTEVQSYNSTLPSGSKLRPFLTPHAQ
jgi:hypothetical protein